MTSPSGTLPSGVTAGAKRVRSSICPACGAEAIRSGPHLICIFDDCTTHFAAKPSVQSALSVSSMAQHTMEGTARASIIEGQGGHD
jgi:hypothetical protein